MNENVLREFLVSLGFTVDEAGLKKFNTAVEGVTKSVMQAGLAVAGTAAGIVAGVKIISSQMENLYYASQRTGATVGNIMALRYAAGQIGLTADQAQGSLENFARTLRLNPGSSSLLDSLGVQGKDPTEKFDSFIGKMKQMQPYVAAAYAQLFGIDPDTLLMLEQGQDKRLADEQAYRLKLAKFGINPEQAAESGKDFNNSIRAVKDTFNDLWIVIESKLTPVLTPLIEKFELWSETHAGDVANAIADAVQRLADWLGQIDWDKTLNKIDHFVDLANQAAKAVGGWGNALVILAGIKFASIIAGIGGLTGALTSLLGLAAGFAGWKVGDAIRDQVDKFITEKSGGKYRSLSDILTGTDRSKLNATGGYTQEEVDSVKDQGGAKLTPPRPKTGGQPSLHDAYDAAKQAQDKYGIPAQVTLAQYGLESGFGKRMPAGSNNPFGIKARDGQPYVEAETTEYVNGVAQRVKQKFAKFDSLADSFDAHARLLAFGKPYAEARQHENDPAAFADSLTGVYATDPKYGTKLKSLMSSLGGARLGDRTSSSPPVSITQTNTFSIAGSTDPQGTARAIGAEQSRLNGDMVRNLSGAVA